MFNARLCVPFVALAVLACGTSDYQKDEVSSNLAKAGSPADVDDSAGSSGGGTETSGNDSGQNDGSGDGSRDANGSDNGGDKGGGSGNGDDDAPLVVTGVLTNEGVECPALRTDNGRLYTLAGSTSGFSAGDRVRVRGSRAEMSICQQGTTINVSKIERA